MKCNVRGHNHNLNLIRKVIQKETLRAAELMECPTGNYRWLVFEGRPVEESIRFSKPRFGWKKT